MNKKEIEAFANNLRESGTVVDVLNIDLHKNHVPKMLRAWADGIDNGSLEVLSSAVVVELDVSPDIQQIKINIKKT